MDKDITVYSDGRYILARENGIPCISICGKKYKLTCHPYEPCLYITDEDGNMTAVHNSFDPESVLYWFRAGKTITSITGMEYDALDFCRMVEYAAGLYDIGIDEAERVFGDRAKKKNPAPEKKERASFGSGETVPPKDDRIIEKDPALDLLNAYPDCIVDYCLVMDEDGRGYSAHWMALVGASRKLFIDDDGEVIWQFDAAKAKGSPISPEELFAPLRKDGELNYRKAFMEPPYPNGYTDSDFDKVNAALFPCGTDGLEVYQWTTGWSEYFDEGHEWWGTLCITVYDKSLKRFVVIMASATD